MVVGVCSVTLFIHGNSSLKGKRQVLKSIVEKVKNRFNVSVAEVGAHDVWQRAEVGLCAVGNDSSHVNSVLDNALNYIYSLNLAEVTDHRIELVNV